LHGENQTLPKPFLSKDLFTLKAKSLKNVERRSRRKWLGGCAHKKYEEMAGCGRSLALPSSLS
jgi:hypothetical protein